MRVPAATVLRIFGACVLTAGVALGVLTYQSLANAADMGGFLATMCAWAAWRSRHPKTF